MRLPAFFQHASAMTLLILVILIPYITAQNLPKLPDQSSDTASQTDTAAATTTDSKNTDTAKTTDAATTTDSKNTNTAKTTDTAATTTDKPSDKPSTTKLPTMSSTSDKGSLSGLPKLDQDNYPSPSVPPTAGAPFMHKSNLPEGTVFICVGAALGFIGFMVLAWRGFMAWSLHRSVKRVAEAQTAKYAGKDPLLGLKAKSPYISPGPGSTLSLDKLGASGKVPASKTHSAHNSLFFSPTAGAGMNAAGNRGSGYLPSGYYAAGNSAPASGAGMTHIGGGARPLSHLSNQALQASRRNSRGPSPPGSPSLPPSRGADSVLSGRLSTQGLVGQASNSTLNLNAPSQGRAPSAYLEDLFENHPPGKPPTEERRSSRRY